MLCYMVISAMQKNRAGKNRNSHDCNPSLAVSCLRIGYDLHPVSLAFYHNVNCILSIAHMFLEWKEWLIKTVKERSLSHEIIVILLTWTLLCAAKQVIIMSARMVPFPSPCSCRFCKPPTHYYIFSWKLECF